MHRHPLSGECSDKVEEGTEAKIRNLSFSHKFQEVHRIWRTSWRPYHFQGADASAESIKIPKNSLDLLIIDEIHNFIGRNDGQKRRGRALISLKPPTPSSVFQQRQFRLNSMICIGSSHSSHRKNILPRNGATRWSCKHLSTKSCKA